MRSGALSLVVASSHGQAQASCTTGKIGYLHPGSTCLKCDSAGVLMTYGPNRALYSARAVAIADGILKGDKPGDFPIKGPDQFELLINLKIAKALRLTIPQSLLLRADEIIE